MKGVKKVFRMKPRNSMFAHRRMAKQLGVAHAHNTRMHGRRLCGIPLPRLSLGRRRRL